MNKTGTIIAPELPASLPSNTQWLSGQGTGTWFCIAATGQSNRYQVKRFKPSGELDCDRVFEIEESGLVFDINEPYQFTHVSHCAKCR
ncbi:MAG: hypothetical protein JKX68_13775, partial [Flavobacteriales bacterium]|nr:hypothetical protein [Flavobacteriales bacterium]